MPGIKSSTRIELQVLNHVLPGSESGGCYAVEKTERILTIDGAVVAREIHKFPWHGELYKLEYICVSILGGDRMYRPESLSFKDIFNEKRNYTKANIRKWEENCKSIQSASVNKTISNNSRPLTILMKRLLKRIFAPIIIEIIEEQKEKDRQRVSEMIKEALLKLMAGE